MILQGTNTRQQISSDHLLQEIQREKPSGAPDTVLKHPGRGGQLLVLPLRELSDSLP